MKPSLYTSALLILAAACGPVDIYHLEGVSTAQLTRDEAICRTDALKAVPVDTRTRIVPGTIVPRTHCNATGHCYTHWVQLAPTRYETYDANEGPRRTYVHNCMLGKGYERSSLPRCAPEVVKQTALTQTTELPAITEESCIIRFESGGWQIVTPPS